MRIRTSHVLAALSIFLLPPIVTPLFAQDSNGPSPLSFLDTSGFSYNYLVDGSLTQDNPAANTYATLAAAYAAAPAGTPTNPTVIGIKPNVYILDTGPVSPGMNITKNYITLLGLTNDHRNVVLANNRGNQQGAGSATQSYNGYVVIVSATGFTAINLTFLNYCNVNYEYPGDATKNLTERSAVVTQAVAIQTGGDQHIFDHVAFLSKLDTTFIFSTRAYFNSVYIEGTNDFVGGGTVSVWENSVMFFPTGTGEPTVTGTVFVNSQVHRAGWRQVRILYKAARLQAELTRRARRFQPPSLTVCFLSTRGATRIRWCSVFLPPGKISIPSPTRTSIPMGPPYYWLTPRKVRLRMSCREN